MWQLQFRNLSRLCVWADSFADEQAYVQFLSDVTSDILARGVFTNRILKRLMAAHVDRHKGKLDKVRERRKTGFFSSECHQSEVVA